MVVDECHAYRGVFGSHVALVLRRLLRLARLYGSDPVVVFASATSADPAAAASRLIGRPVWPSPRTARPGPAPTSCSGSPACWPAAEGQDGAPVRRSAPAEAARMMADLVAAGRRTLTFVRSRHGAEQTALSAQRRLTEAAPELAGQGGRLPRRLSAGGAPGTRTGAGLRRAAGRGLDERPRARGRHRRAGRGRAGRLPGHAGLGLAAGRARRAAGQRRPAGAGGLRRPGRSAGHLPGASPGDGLRPADGGGRHRPDQPVHPRPAPGLRGGRAAPDRGRPRAVRRRVRSGRCWTRSGRAAHPAPPADRLLLGRARPPRRDG